jgi:hypothetical protein
MILPPHFNIEYWMLHKPFGFIMICWFAPAPILLVGTWMCVNAIYKKLSIWKAVVGVIMSLSWLYFVLWVMTNYLGPL